MNREEIIRIYSQVSDELCNGTEWCWAGVGEPLQRFANLVAEAERKAVLEMIDEFVGMERDRNTMFSDGHDYALHQVTEFVLARGQG